MKEYVLLEDHEMTNFCLPVDAPAHYRVPIFIYHVAFKVLKFSFCSQTL